MAEVSDSYYRGDPEPDPPNALQVEPVEGCNLRCGFCGIRAIREQGTRGDLSGPYRFMELPTAAAIGVDVATAGWTPRVELAMHGEPTLHPQLVRLVRTLRRGLPAACPLMLTTNGIPLLERAGGWAANVDDLFAAGIDTIAVDDYRPHRCREAFDSYRGDARPLRYPDDPAGNPHRRPDRDERRLILVQDIAEAATGTHSLITNQGGAAGPPTAARAGQRCGKPFRELSVRYDGTVAICCDDWRGVYRIGQLGPTVTLADVWRSPRFAAARRKLYAGQRDFGACNGCDVRTYRPGLLPDRLGREELPAPDAADAAVLAEALAAGPAAPVVLRRWEAR